jgi:hypothetical protein
MLEQESAGQLVAPVWIPALTWSHTQLVISKHSKAVGKTLPTYLDLETEGGTRAASSPTQRTQPDPAAAAAQIS